MRERVQLIIIAIVALAVIGTLVAVAASYINFDNLTDSGNVTLDVNNNSTSEKTNESLLDQITSPVKDKLEQVTGMSGSSSPKATPASSGSSSSSSRSGSSSSGGSSSGSSSSGGSSSGGSSSGGSSSGGSSSGGSSGGSSYHDDSGSSSSPVSNVPEGDYSIT